MGFSMSLIIGSVWITLYLTTPVHSSCSYYGSCSNYYYYYYYYDGDYYDIDDALSLSAGAIAGIAVGSITGLTLLIALVTCICKKLTNTSTRQAVVYPGGVATTVQAQGVIQAQAYPMQGQAYPQPPPGNPVQGARNAPPNSEQIVPPPKYSTS
ncbi:uncharacterized protein LOC132546558 [Ylistrum balloti]|uniref:uncharacterized protein LOC132546558 n=1 Tax=Ylistrum balloti TaxID=509963 RepID=UPI0029057DCF|nr:uncharacterized protein LOC132546558 [Ylistrum balloti]